MLCVVVCMFQGGCLLCWCVCWAVKLMDLISKLVVWLGHSAHRFQTHTHTQKHHETHTHTHTTLTHTHNLYTQHTQHTHNIHTTYTRSPSTSSSAATPAVETEATVQTVAASSSKSQLEFTMALLVYGVSSLFVVFTVHSSQFTVHNSQTTECTQIRILCCVNSDRAFCVLLVPAIHTAVAAVHAHHCGDWYGDADERGAILNFAGGRARKVVLIFFEIKFWKIVKSPSEIL